MTAMIENHRNARFRAFGLSQSDISFLVAVGPEVAGFNERLLAFSIDLLGLAAAIDFLAIRYSYLALKRTAMNRLANSLAVGLGPQRTNVKSPSSCSVVVS
jgi:hypothetical protein